MTIGSDFSKTSLSAFHTGQEKQVTEQEFLQKKHKEAQVVAELADSNKTSNEQDSSRFEYSESKTNEAQVDTPIVEDVNFKMRQLSVGLSFEVAEDGKENVVKVIDQETGDLVRQIPSEEFLEMSKRLDEIFGELKDLKGNLVNSEV